MGLESMDADLKGPHDVTNPFDFNLWQSTPVELLGIKNTEKLETILYETSTNVGLQISNEMSSLKAIDFYSTISTVHQKQHYVPYYLSIVLLLSLKYAFGIISMFFTLVRCSIVLLMFLLTYCIHVSYLMSKFIAFLNVFLCLTRNVPYGKSCLLWNLGLQLFLNGTLFSSST